MIEVKELGKDYFSGHDSRATTDSGDVPVGGAVEMKLEDGRRIVFWVSEWGGYSILPAEVSQ